MTKEKYKQFHGKLIETIPKLITEGRKILSTAEFMQFRLDNPEMYRGWDNTTSDAIVYHPDGRIKIVYDSEHIKELNPKNEKDFGWCRHTEIEFKDKVYESLKGREFLLEEIVTPFGLSAKGAESNLFWQCLARENQALLSSYVDFVFKRGLNHAEQDIVLYGDKETEDTYRAMGLSLFGGDFYEIAPKDRRGFSPTKFDKPFLHACVIRGIYCESSFNGEDCFNTEIIGVLNDKDEGKNKKSKIKLPKNKSDSDRFSEESKKEKELISFSRN